MEVAGDPVLEAEGRVDLTRSGAITARGPRPGALGTGAVERGAGRRMACDLRQGKSRSRRAVDGQGHTTAWLLRSADQVTVCWLVGPSTCGPTCSACSHQLISLKPRSPQQNKSNLDQSAHSSTIQHPSRVVIRELNNPSPMRASATGPRPTATFFCEFTSSQILISPPASQTHSSQREEPKMHACRVPAAGPLLCPAIAMLLLALLLASLPTTAAAAAVKMSMVPCAPAQCGNLSIYYPFWLTGTHQRHCGYKAFQVTCEERKVYLKNSYWVYQVLDISYENSSFVVTNVNLQKDGSFCNLNLVSNASSDLSAAPFRISSRNLELFFLSGCPGQARQRQPSPPSSWAQMNCSDYDNGSAAKSFAWLAGKYRPDDTLNPPLPLNCTVSKLMPVLGYQGAGPADYDRLMNLGFLLEHNFTAEDCAACASTGNRCSVDPDDDQLVCNCSDGQYWFICGQYVCRPLRFSNSF
jgi:hypothetical protein